jgi:YjbE family integral membrane protein
VWRAKMAENMLRMSRGQPLPLLGKQRVSMDLHWVGLAVAVVLVDLSLSGDNAVVIGAVAARLPPHRRRFAISFGILMAIVARIALAATAVLVLQLPYVKAIGGVIVLLIAGQMIFEQIRSSAQRDEDAEEPHGWRKLSGKESLFRASVIILAADVTMSLDNILAIVALARGDIAILAIGFAVSMLLLLVASTVVARLIARYPILLYAASAILAWTAGLMVAEDERLHPYLAQLDSLIAGPSVFELVAPAFVVLIALFGLLAWLIFRPRRARTAS